MFLGLLGLVGFLWALRSGQFEDLEGAAHRILIDEDPPVVPARVSPARSPRPPAR
ncbi:MAG TPA: cbb3-type cytochrome oxidase assembly protein CcoS [Verrucomicrobiae bacterium]|nr:cbb3-type cytochrome oxidase assembly protein CcoS [Verrucomicrobiae bacterium]